MRRANSTKSWEIVVTIILVQYVEGHAKIVVSDNMILEIFLVLIMLNDSQIANG